MTLQQVRCFLATVRAGSFTGAADLLGVTQPAVAEQVRNLEHSLGIALFSRLGRGVQLTEAGVAFADHAPAVLAALEAAVSTVADVRDVRTGTLAFGLFATPEAYGIDRLVSRFARQHPGLRLRLLGRNSAQVADRVRRGDLEAGLIVLPIDDDGLDVTPVARDEVVYVSARPQRAGSTVRADTLAGRDLILYDAEAGDRDPLRRQLAERAQALGGRLSARIEAETMVMALRLVADGIGDTYLPRAHTKASYFPSGLSVVPIRPTVHETFAVVSRRGARLSPATAKLSALIQEHMRHPDLGLEAV